MRKKRVFIFNVCSALYTAVLVSEREKKLEIFQDFLIHRLIGDD